MRRMILAITVLTFAAAPALAATCKDSKGRFIKCRSAAVVKATGGVTKDKNGKCHIASGPKKGQFTRCA